MARRFARVYAVLVVLCAALLLSAFQRAPKPDFFVRPPTCYGPACEPNGECNFMTEMGTCISLCPCAWDVRKPAPRPQGCQQNKGAK